MHPSLYHEFHISLAPRAAVAPASAPEIYISLQHSRTGQEVGFVMPAGATPDRAIEENVLRAFPHSVAAQALRELDRGTRHSLTPAWDQNLGDRIYRAMSELSTSNGAQFWTELIPTLPSVLYSTMNARAADRLALLGLEFELSTAISAVRDAWLAVLSDARGIPMRVTGMQRLALDIQGWNTESLRNMSIMDYSRLKEKALFAKLAVAYLTHADWVAILGTLTEPTTLVTR